MVDKTNVYYSRLRAEVEKCFWFGDRRKKTVDHACNLITNGIRKILANSGYPTDYRRDVDISTSSFDRNYEPHDGNSMGVYFEFFSIRVRFTKIYVRVTM